jgi:hypothetical protein
MRAAVSRPKLSTREKIRRVCYRRARLSVEIWNKSEMERRQSEIVSAETLTKCILFRALPSPGVTCFWTTAPDLGGDAFAFSALRTLFSSVQTLEAAVQCTRLYICGAEARMEHRTSAAIALY